MTQLSVPKTLMTHNWRIPMLNSALIVGWSGYVWEPTTFGKRNLASAAPAEATRIPHPTDADGVARVFPKELWDNPQIGDALRKAGYTPDMPQNVLETREDRVARVKASAMRGIQREMALKAELQARHGPVSIMPLMIIDNEVWTADANGDWLQDMMDYEPCEEMEHHLSGAGRGDVTQARHSDASPGTASPHRQFGQGAYWRA
jgi:hypothetical protein